MGNSVKTVMNKTMQSNIPVSYNQFPMKMGAHGMLMVFREHTYTNPGSYKLLSGSNIRSGSVNSILLPIPNNLQDSNEIRLSRSDLGVFGTARADFARRIAETAGSNAGDDYTSMLMSALSDITPDGRKAAQIAFNGGEARVDLIKQASYLARSSLPDVIAKGIDIGTSSTPNPKTALTFEGTELKTHSFQWVLMPKSEEESERLKLITNILKRIALPKYGDRSKLYMKYPHTVDIFLIGVDEDSFAKFKTSMIRSLTVNPTAQNGLSLLKGGRPSSVTIDMNLMETDIHTAEDYEGGTYS